MPDITHQILLRGRIARHLLGPFRDEFTVDHDEVGVTRLVGTVRDPSHVHGLVAYLASINAELIAITPVTSPSNPDTSNPNTSNPSTSNPRSSS